MTPNEITTVLASGFDKVFDVPFKLMLMERVDMWRARHIKNALDKLPSDRRFFKSTVYLSTTEADPVKCALPFTQCKVYETSVIPEPLRANGILFDYLGSINGNHPFMYAESGTAFYRLAGRYSRNKVAYNYSDRKIYLTSNVPMIRLEFISAKPKELADYSCDPSGQDCDWWNLPYPCPPEILQLIFQSIREVDFRQDPKLAESSIPVNPVNDLAQ